MRAVVLVGAAITAAADAAAARAVAVAQAVELKQKFTSAEARIAQLEAQPEARTPPAQD